MAMHLSGESLSGHHVARAQCLLRHVHNRFGRMTTGFCTAHPQECNLQRVLCVLMSVDDLDATYHLFSKSTHLFLRAVAYRYM